MLSSHPISIGNKRPLTAAGMRLFFVPYNHNDMAKLSQDKIEWILSLNATQAQEEIRKVTKENKELEKKAAAAQQVLASVPQGTAKWKKAEANLKAYKKQISENNAMLLELNKQLDDESRSLVTNNL